MSEYSKPISVQIDTTTMEDTEVRIIESHLDAIARVVEGATPQGSPEPEPVPEWRRLVDEAIRYLQAEPTPPCELGDLLFVLADADGNVMWRQIGEAAAAWLRDITEATS